jgi:hypothetical protein
MLVKVIIEARMTTAIAIAQDRRRSMGSVAARLALAQTRVGAAWF